MKCFPLLGTEHGAPAFSKVKLGQKYLRVCLGFLLFHRFVGGFDEGCNKLPEVSERWSRWTQGKGFEKSRNRFISISPKNGWLFGSIWAHGFQWKKWWRIAPCQVLQGEIDVELSPESTEDEIRQARSQFQTVVCFLPKRTGLSKAPRKKGVRIMDPIWLPNHLASYFSQRDLPGTWPSGFSRPVEAAHVRSGWQGSAQRPAVLEPGGRGTNGWSRWRDTCPEASKGGVVVSANLPFRGANSWGVVNLNFRWEGFSVRTMTQLKFTKKYQKVRGARFKWAVTHQNPGKLRTKSLLKERFPSCLSPALPVVHLGAVEIFWSC